MEGLELLLYSENTIKDSEDTNVDIPKRRMNVRTGSRIRLYVEVIRLLEQHITDNIVKAGSLSCTTILRISVVSF